MPKWPSKDAPPFPTPLEFLAHPRREKIFEVSLKRTDRSALLIRLCAHLPFKFCILGFVLILPDAIIPTPIRTATNAINPDIKAALSHFRFLTHTLSVSISLSQNDTVQLNKTCRLNWRFSIIFLLWSLSCMYFCHMKLCIILYIFIYGQVVIDFFSFLPSHQLALNFRTVWSLVRYVS